MRSSRSDDANQVQNRLGLGVNNAADGNVSKNEELIVISELITAGSIRE